MGNMLKIQERIGEYTVGEKLSTRHDGYREVYSAVDTDGMPVVITVFDILADRYADARKEGRHGTDIVDEIRFLKATRGMDGLPSFLDCGTEGLGGREYAWMAQEYAEGESLHSLIRGNHAIGTYEAVGIARQIGRVAERVAVITKGGGHYNISTDNILVGRDNEGRHKAYLIGFSNIGESHQGAHSIDLNSLDKRFRTPESSKGIFSHKTDVYALAMVTAIMMSGYPSHIETESFSIDYGTEEINMEEFSTTEFHDAVWKNARENLPISTWRILEKGSSPTAAKRFGTMGKFIEFLGRIASGQRGQLPEAKGERPEDREPVALTSRGQNMRTAAKSIQKGNEKTGNGEKAMDAVAGMEELKNLFRRDFIRIVRNPEVARAYGIKPSNCTLLYGPQGCGKTFIAEKAAQESGLKYRVINPSELGSIYVHGAQQKIAELFDEAEKKGPMILIFDEFDALVPKRDSENFHNQSNEVNEMLTQLNNCAARGIYVLATTNRPTLLDPAIMRKGRVDRTVFVSLPDQKARKELFRMEVEKRPHGEMDYDALAGITENYTCSDIAYIVEESARLCFEETIDSKPEDLIPIGMERLKEVIKNTCPSVTDMQRKEYQDLKDMMEKRDGGIRKRVGFAL